MSTDDQTLVAASLEGPTWKWVNTTYSNGSTVASPDPAKYTLRFDQATKRFIFTADCNNGSGSYTVDGQNLAMHVEGMTYTLVKVGGTEVGGIMATPPEAQGMPPAWGVYVAVDDVGKVINPMIVKGQIVGGIVQGTGQALWEHGVYDENGQLLNASLMDYLLVSATEMPAKMELAHVVSPSPLNPLGLKGVGEAGAIPVPACMHQAIENAYSNKIEITTSPMSPSSVS